MKCLNMCIWFQRTSRKRMKILASIKSILRMCLTGCRKCKDPSRSSIAALYGRNESRWVTRQPYYHQHYGDPFWQTIFLFSIPHENILCFMKSSSEILSSLNLFLDVACSKISKMLKIKNNFFLFWNCISIRKCFQSSIY